MNLLLITKIPSWISDRIFLDCNSTCWNWLGRVTFKGYGVHRFNGKFYKAHREIYKIIKGEIPEGFVIDHLCNNPSCINPEHLEAKTNKDNVRRGSHVILTLDLARKIIELYATGKYTRDKLAKKLKLNEGTVGAVISRRNWSDAAPDIKFEASNKIPKKEVLEIVELIRKGKSYTYIANKYKISTTSVGRIRKKFKISLIPVKSRNRNKNKAIIEKSKIEFIPIKWN